VAYSNGVKRRDIGVTAAAWPKASDIYQWRRISDGAAATTRERDG